MENSSEFVLPNVDSVFHGIESVSYLQSVKKIMRKTAIWEISCFYPLPPLNNVEKQRAKVASSYIIGSQHCIGGEGDF